VIGLASLIAATIAFVGSHFLLSHTYRLKLIGAVGELRFTLLYSVVALATFAWMVVAYRALDDELPLWLAPDWWWPIASAIMLVASILLIGSFVRNPAFPHPGAAQRKRPATGVFAITRHPMNWSFALWAAVHLTLWGEPRNIVVDLGILILALAGSVGQDRKKRASIGPAWVQWGGEDLVRPLRGPAHRPRPLARRRTDLDRGARRPRLLAGRRHLARPGLLADRLGLDDLPLA
jgi:uncharacterized membrane protein